MRARSGNIIFVYKDRLRRIADHPAVEQSNLARSRPIRWNKRQQDFVGKAKCRATCKLTAHLFANSSFDSIMPYVPYQLVGVPDRLRVSVIVIRAVSFGCYFVHVAML